MKSSIKVCFSILILIAMTGCNSKESVDLIVTNGKVYAADSSFTVAQAFAVKKGKIQAVGTSVQISAKYTSDNSIDLEGKFVFPGFNDAHCHFFGYGIDLLQYADLTGTQSKEEIYEILKSHHQKFGGQWILGRGWDQNDWPDKSFPDKAELDRLFPDNPVYLERVDGHAGWCNSKALNLAGVSASSKVDGGEVFLKNGEPSGILLDNAEGLVMKVMPDLTDEQCRKALLEAQTKCLAAGLTSVTDCGVSKGAVLLMDKLQREGILKIRINPMLNPSDENIEYFVKKGEYKTELLHVNTIKLYIDGALGSRGALLFEDYSDDPGNRGLQMEKQEYYDRICKLAFEHKYQVATHAIGDSGNRVILNTYGKFLLGQNDRRWRIEHAQVVHPADFKLFKKYSVVPSIQGTHATSDMYWAEDRLGQDRVKGAYANQQLLQQLGWLPNGTDFPVEGIDPLRTFYASAFRMDDRGWPEGGWQIENALTRKQTLLSMTIWAAKASFDEKEKGSIEKGKWADFVILDTDLMTAPPHQIPETKVLNTYIAGEKVFDRNN
jgi:predicted amidohydrolase YtcJ